MRSGSLAEKIDYVSRKIHEHEMLKRKAQEEIYRQEREIKFFQEWKENLLKKKCGECRGDGEILKILKDRTEYCRNCDGTGEEKLV
jgi:DnaJ-class molecular chaperone